MAKRASFIHAALGLAIVLPAPALAEENRVAEAARQLDDPMTQIVVAGALAAVTKQVLETRVAPFLRAMEAYGADDALPDVPPDATVGDLAGADSERLARQIMQRVPRLMGSLADMSSAYGDMLPEIEAAAKRLKDAVPHR